MKKRIFTWMILATLILSMTGCTEASQVSYNVSKEANNFNVTRKITVVNVRSDSVLFEMIGTFSISNSEANELQIICQTAENEFKKHFIYLNEWTTYVVEDISGSDVNKYHYELNILPEWGVTVTHDD
jgi:hypothetical protein